MKNSVKSIIWKLTKATTFTLVFIILLNQLLVLFTPKWFEDRWFSIRATNSFYDLEDNSLEVFCVGPSNMASAIDPYQMYEEYGISAYNLGFVSQPPIGSYYWVKEAIKNHNIKAVVYEVKPISKKESKIESGARKSFDTMEWGLNKLQYAINYCKYSQLEADNKNAEGDDSAEGAEYINYLFPLSVYHSRWTDLKEEDFAVVTGDDIGRSKTRGWAMITSTSKRDYKGQKSLVKEGELPSYNETNTLYLKKMIELCQENDIEIILMKAPDSSWGPSPSTYVQNIADEYGVEFIDFNSMDMMEEIGYDYYYDGADAIHTNIRGAKKLTAYIGKYLKDNVQLTDFREDRANNKELEEGLSIYKYALEDYSLRMINNADEYFERIKGDQYSYILVSGGNASLPFTDQQKFALESIGIENKVFENLDDDTNTIVFVDGDNTRYVSESVTDSEGNTVSTSIEGVMKNGLEYKITSAPGQAYFQIGANTETIKFVGRVNLVVYDNESNQVADIVAINNNNGKIGFSR